MEKQRWRPTLLLKMSGMGRKVRPGEGVAQASEGGSGEMKADTAGGDNRKSRSMKENHRLQCHKAIWEPPDLGQES